MAFYADADTFCEVMTDLFSRAMTRPSAVNALRETAMVVELVTRDPQVVLLVNGQSQPPSFSCGHDGVTPDLRLTMSADVLHKVWLGKTRLRDAFFFRQIRVEGPLMRAMSLQELFRQVEALYPHVLEEHGLLDGK